MPRIRPCPLPSAWIEIDLAAVRHNFRELRKLAFEQLEPKINRSVDLLSVVKADSYGHGMIEVAKVIEKEGGRFFAVSNVQEGIQLRGSGNRRRILLFESTLPELAAAIVRYDLTPAICTLELALEVDRLARRARKAKFPVHIKVDTGMGRLGVWHAQAAQFVREVNALKGLHVEGIFTHFPLADTDKNFTEQQMDVFSKLVAQLIKDQIPFRYLHAANSMGIVAYKNRFFNLARPGVMLYGLYPSAGLKRKIGLKAAMTVKARVIFKKTIFKGCGVSYGHTFYALGDIPVAVLSIGYSDGYFRSVSNKAHVLINGMPCPVLGRVTMDQTIVDISCAGKVSVGDEAVILGCQGDNEISAEEFASWAGTINYEVACNLGNRLPRVYKKL